jgi:hypothetical protein
MISKEQARRQVQSELQSLKLQKPMSDWDVSIFAVQMARKLPFSSAGSSRYKAICGWVHELATRDVSGAADLEALLC